MKEVSIMTVKEIFRPIMLNDNVAIRYCDYEVKHIYSESCDNDGSWLVIAIIV